MHFKKFRSFFLLQKFKKRRIDNDSSKRDGNMDHKSIASSLEYVIACERASTNTSTKVQRKTIKIIFAAHFQFFFFISLLFVLGKWNCKLFWYRHEISIIFKVPQHAATMEKTFLSHVAVFLCAQDF